MQGALVQMNLSSIEGKYGKRVNKTARQMLKHCMVHFVGTDSHSPGKVLVKMKDRVDMLAYYCRDNVCDMLYYNPEKIIKNELISINEPEKIKDRFFKRPFANGALW
jgi:protein-tyrosine phosphatase